MGNYGPKKYCYNLNGAELFKLATKCCCLALPIWQTFADSHELTYRDTVVGLRHEVNKNLLYDSVLLCQGATLVKTQLKKLLDEFCDPIVALQDDDWELPEEVRFVFYAVYNLLE